MTVDYGVKALAAPAKADLSEAVSLLRGPLHYLYGLHRLEACFSEPLDSTNAPQNPQNAIIPPPQHNGIRMRASHDRTCVQQHIIVPMQHANLHTDHGLLSSSECRWHAC